MALKTIDVTRTTTPRPRPDESQLGFGKYFADHMLVLEYGPQGWDEPRIVPYGPLSLDPAASGLHYGQAMFEGLKAFRQQDGRVALFRIDDHMKRLAAARRACRCRRPTRRRCRDAIVALVSADKDWVPSQPGTALYMRPIFIGTEPSSASARRRATCSTSSPRRSAPTTRPGFKPVKIWVETEAVRAVQGGIGWVKAAANYVASMKTADDVRARGYEQVLWLDAIEHRFVEEVGTMNLFAVIGDELLTPPLAGSILAGITRDTVLTLASDWGLTHASARSPSRRSSTPTQTARCARCSARAPPPSSRASASWATPTARSINNGEIGPLAQRLYDAITSIQYGTAPDTHDWLTFCD